MKRKDAADVYYVRVQPIDPGDGPTRQSDVIHETGPILSITSAQRAGPADLLADYPDVIMKWRIYCRHSTDTSTVRIAGEENRFVIVGPPPMGP